MPDLQLSAVDEYLGVLRRIRAETINAPYRDAVTMDLRRSASAAADALTADGSPHAAKVREFVDATEREDRIMRVKNGADKVVTVGKAAATIAGNENLATLMWPAIIGGGLGAILVGYLLVTVTAAGLMAAAVGAVPIGWLLSRGGYLAGGIANQFGDYMQTPDAARQIVNSQLVPAERKFYVAVPGHAPVIRASTVAAAGAKSLVSALFVSVAVGLLIGLLAGASAKG